MQVLKMLTTIAWQESDLSSQVPDWSWKATEWIFSRARPAIEAPDPAPAKAMSQHI